MKKEIIEKIKKLLRMKRGATHEEFETALSLAQKLAAKHGIDITSINPDEQDREPITDELIAKLSRISWEAKYSSLIVKQFFSVESFTDYRGVIFVGTKTNIEIAQYVFNFLVGRFRYEWKINRGRLRKRQSFMWGMYTALCHKLYEELPTPARGEGLIVVNNKSAINNYIENKFGKMESSSAKPDNESRIAANRGYNSGLNTHIRKGVSGYKQTKLLE